jgi:cytochrome bd ubiquinol oxidase subunit II
MGGAESLSHDFFAITWFGVWGLIWTVYFMLESYKLGAGMIFPLVAKNQKQQSQLKDVIGPFWSGNEVLLIAAGGATFAAFPGEYADMFSFLYEAIFLIIFSQIIRVIGIEIMLKSDSPKWQNFWKWTYSLASLIISFLFGVTYANIYRAILVGDKGYGWDLFDLMNGYGIIGGILFVVMFLLSGSLWVQLKTNREMAFRSKKLSKPFLALALIVLTAFFIITMNWTPLVANFMEIRVLLIIPIISFLSLILAAVFVFRGNIKMAFRIFCLSIITQMATGFIGMFPKMQPSKIDDSFSVTLYQAAGNTLNFKLIVTVGLFLVPIIILITIWKYVSYRDSVVKDNVKTSE